MADVQLLEHDPRWNDLFRAEDGRIRRLLGAKALRIEHVGSTSVAGLVAKPVIDIVLEVADAADELQYRPALENGGYVLRIREPEWFAHRMFNGPEWETNLHVFSAGCPETNRMAHFRDWLRANPADRDLYAKTKLALAQRSWDSIQDYADAKTGVIAGICERMNAASK